jgi:hypothetical protein
MAWSILSCVMNSSNLDFEGFSAAPPEPAYSTRLLTGFNGGIANAMNQIESD